MARIDRPEAGDFAPYYEGYVGLVQPGDLLETLERESGATLAMVRAVTPEMETYRYAADKWSVREVVGHLIDTERLFAYRALSFARGDSGPLPGMDQNEWNTVGGAHGVELSYLADELDAVRRATIAQFGRMDAAALSRRGMASGVEFTVRAFPWIIAGHELHHRGILADRYLNRGGEG